MNQCEMVVDYMKRNGSITTREAFINLGITRLSARIYELKEAGYAFDCETVKVRNRNGAKVTVTRYTFKGADNEQG